MPSARRQVQRPPGGGWLGWAVKRLLASALLAYVASYVYLYERGVAEADAIGYPFFFYVSIESLAADRDLTRHYQLSVLYEPINLAHRRWFRGRGPCRGIIFGFSR
jgi:hypothetical protein